MKAIRYFFITLTGVMLFAACEKFLDKTPEASVSNADVFGTYQSFQGYFDPNYTEIRSYNSHYNSSTMNMGGETSNSSVNWSQAWDCWTGNYWRISGMDDPTETTSNFHAVGYGYGENATSGIWTGGWRGIRVCNTSLKNFHLLSEATDEERRLLLGQIYFFRAFFHQQIIDAFGGMPYVDSVFNPNDEMKLPRLTYQETAEEIVKDFDKAIELLPENWDQTTRGSQSPGSNTGRATKGTALAYKAKVLLYAGSPLMNKFSGGDETYNKSYCERAAAAGWEMIQLANKVVGGKKLYELVPWANYTDNFTKMDATYPWTTETIFELVRYASGNTNYGHIGRQNSFPRMGGKYSEQVNQVFVDKFEMLDGTRYNPAVHDIDNAKRWDYRDPRFRNAVIVDKDQHGLDSRSIIRLYVGTGSDRVTAQQIYLPYLLKKHWPIGCNVFDNKQNNLRRVTPLMRLAEVYLDYAEAVTAAYGPSGRAPGGITAVEAVNIVRRRAGMPDVTAEATGYANFMDLVRNERAVELCFEGHYWYDIRRWYIAHLPENRSCINLLFDKDWTPSSFSRVQTKYKVFENPKHYWLPLSKDLCLLYPGFGQNPGWQ